MIGSTAVKQWKMDLMAKKVDAGDMLPHDVAAWLIQWSFDGKKLRQSLERRGDLPYNSVEFHRIMAIGIVFLLCFSVGYCET